jgi:hypothetical protein
MAEGISIYCPECKAHYFQQKRAPKKSLGKPVEVWFKDCGSPDVVSKARAEDWWKHGELEAGDMIRWEDGRKTVIEAAQAVLF